MVLLGNVSETVKSVFKRPRIIRLLDDFVSFFVTLFGEYIYTIMSRILPKTIQHHQGFSTLLQYILVILV